MFFLLATKDADAQIMFQTHYGGNQDDGGSSVLQTDDGGYIVAGRTLSYGNGSNDIYVLKTDGNGNEVWTKTYGGNGWDAPYEIKKTLDNCYIIAGETSSFGAGASDAFLMKIDSNGDSIWFKTYGGSADDGAYSVDVCNDNSFIVAGVTMSFGEGQSQTYLIKTNEYGDSLWTKEYGPSYANCFGSTVIQTSDFGYLVVGKFSYGNPKLHIIRTNNIGDTLWTKKYGYNGMYSGSTIRKINNSGYAILGTIVNMNNVSDIRLIKINQNGDTIFTKDYGGFNNEVGGEVQKTNDNGFIITGLTQSYGAGGKDVYLIKTDESGIVQWTKTFGGAGDDWGGSVQQTSDNGYIIAGYSKSFSNNYDVYLIKTDENGVSGFEKIVPTSISLKTYPNPTDGLFTLQWNGINEKNVTIQIFNLQGQEVYDKSINSEAQNSFYIDLANKPKGIYIVRFKGNKTLFNNKVIMY